MYDNVKQVVIMRLMKHEESTLNRQFRDFAGFYGFLPLVCRPHRGQTKGLIERTVQYVRDNFMIGTNCKGLDDLNGQAYVWCNKVNAKERGTTGDIPFERMKKDMVVNPIHYLLVLDILFGKGLMVC